MMVAFVIGRSRAYFRFCLFSSLSEHPFLDVRRAADDRDTGRLALVQETNAIEVDEIDLSEIQRQGWPAAFNLGLQLIEVIGPKLSTEKNSRSTLAKNPIDFERHQPCSETQLEERNCLAVAIALKEQYLRSTRVLN
jgi:hypothetical protein